MSELEKYYLYLLREGRKKQTAQMHLDCLKRLFKHCPNLTLDQINSFLLKLHEEGRKATYLNGFLDVLRVYGRFKGTDEWNTLRYFKEETFIKATLSDEEIEQILELPPTRNGEKEKSNYAIWTLFFKILAYSGMRPGEVAHLTIDRVDFGRLVFILEDTKTNTPRYVPIAPTLLSALTAHIQNLTGQVLFPSRRGGQYRQKGVVNDVDWAYNFQARLKRLGIKRKNLSVYSLRHSFITRMLEEDVNLFKVQKIVGHRQIETTAHYTHLTTKDIVKTINQDPLGRAMLPYYDRLKMFREGTRKLLEDLAHSPEEEREMLASI